jgi:alpha,alpha-trehalase
MRTKPQRNFIWGWLLLLTWLLSMAPAEQGRLASPEQLQAVQQYIKNNWTTLRRSNEQLAMAAVDPKLDRRETWPVYISRREDLKRVEAEVSKLMPAADVAKIEWRRLPESVTGITEHGLLYLPYPYVVPGGRFNEMYGWDSYFIQLGLLRDGELTLAKNMIDNFLYQIEHYGRVLNANRTYYLTRSQPPFLTEMILGVYQQTKDKAWLARTLPAIEKYYRFWTKPPHLVPETGLSRYYDLGRGPAPEVIADERDEQGRTHYDRVKEYYRTHKITDYDLSLYYDAKKDRLTDLFYIGDRSMRESGFDPSNRFGPFNVDIIHYAPVCLNTLLYQMEREAAEILTTLDRPKEAAVWTRRAEARQQKINQLLWDEKAGLYLDYNVRTRQRRHYPFATTFYPLWAGIASPEQAKRIVANLSLLERPGGLMTSTQVTGSQWDAPFGWAPLQIFAVKGLRRYGYETEANRLTINFLSLILKEFIEHNVIVEKYDVVRRESDVAADIRFGYATNVIGFGWSNAAFVELYAELPEGERMKVRQLSGVTIMEPIKEGKVSLAEKISALEASQHLRRRAARGRLADFDKVLSLVPDVEPGLEEDQVTDGNG